MRYDSIRDDVGRTGNIALLLAAIDLHSAWQRRDLLTDDERQLLKTVLQDGVSPDLYAKRENMSVEAVHDSIRDAVLKLQNDLNGGDTTGT